MIKRYKSHNDNYYIQYKCIDGQFFYNRQDNLAWVYTYPWTSWEQLNKACKDGGYIEIIIKNNHASEIDYLDYIQDNFKEGG